MDSDPSQSLERAWPVSTMEHMYTGVPGLLSFHFYLQSIVNASSWHNGFVPVPLRDVRTVSLENITSVAYLESEIWWRALKDAIDVHRISVYVGDCAALLPKLSERISAHSDAAFAMFPRLKFIHVHVEDPFTVDDYQLDDKEDACAGSLASLQSLVHTRRVQGSPLDYLVVDVALSGWAIWDDIRSDVEIEFFAFYSDDRL